MTKSFKIISELAPFVKDVNHKNNSGQTALSLVCNYFQAVRFDFDQIVPFEYDEKISKLIRILVKCKADATLINPDVYACLPDGVKTILECSNPEGVAKAFGMRGQQEIRKKQLEEDARQEAAQRVALLRAANSTATATPPAFGHGSESYRKLNNFFYTWGWVFK